MSQENLSRLEEMQMHLTDVQALLSRHKLVEDLVHRQEMPRHEMVEGMVHQQNLAELRKKLETMPSGDIARILEALPEEDRLLAWGQIQEERADSILLSLSDEVRIELVGDGHRRSTRAMLNAFELRNGRLRQIPVESQHDLIDLKPIWVDLIAPTDDVRQWVGDFFGLELPDPEELTDLEASARFYVEENGEVHLHSDFLLDMEDESRNVPVALILHDNILFSVRTEELPVFRLQRLRARTRPGYVTDGKDVLLDLYAADAEYSADALEDVYAALGKVGKYVLGTDVTDAEAAKILADIAREEDLNGRIRRNVLDTRRAVSFLMRGRFLATNQQEDARQILRDIESLDGHTSFLFDKINFLMDATVGFVNINQNKIIKRLTVVSVIFMPLNFIAGAGGMSEFSMMTQGIPWPVAYGAFTLAMGAVAYVTFLLLRLQDRFESGKKKVRLSE